MMRHAVITGGSRGIGLAIAKALSERGWGVFLVSQHQANLERASSLLRNVKGSIAVDLGAGEGSARKVGQAVREALGTVDLVVLCAGIFIDESLGAVKEDTFRRNMAVNLEANVYLTKHLLPCVSKGGRGRFVLIGSTAAYEPYPLVPTYGIAKWALRGFALNLRQELKEQGIGVSFVSPGGTLTDMWAGEDLPPERLLSPDDIGKTVALMAELTPQCVMDEIILRPILGDIHE